MEYAVFDWDNTVRDGYTLFSWIDYLYIGDYLTLSGKESIDAIKDMYSIGAISHDEFANLACEFYTKSIKGISLSAYNELVDKYMCIDERNIFPFMVRIFRILSAFNIKVIIISGAPERIIERYKNSFNIDDIFGFREEFSLDGICSGSVAHNYGYNKVQVIRHLVKRFNKSPLMGFGDSSSDYPLLEASKYPFCVIGDKTNEEIQVTGLQYINKAIVNEEIDKQLLMLLEGQRRLTTDIF